MKYLHQAGLIILFTFLGEAAEKFIPFRVPAAIWGLLLLFVCLCTGIIKTEQIRDTARWLTAILPALFVAPTVNLMDQTGALLGQLPQIVLILIIPTMLTFAAAGYVTQFIGKRGGLLHLRDKEKETEA